MKTQFNLIITILISINLCQSQNKLVELRLNFEDEYITLIGPAVYSIEVKNTSLDSFFVSNTKYQLPKLQYYNNSQWYDIEGSQYRNGQEFLPLKENEGYGLFLNDAKVLKIGDYKKYKKSTNFLIYRKDKVLREKLLRREELKVRAFLKFKNGNNVVHVISNEVVLQFYSLRRRDAKAENWLVDNLQFPFVLYEEQVTGDPTGVFSSQEIDLENKLSVFTEKFPKSMYAPKAIMATIEKYTSLAERFSADKLKVQSYLGEITKLMNKLEKRRYRGKIYPKKIDNIDNRLNELKFNAGIINAEEYLDKMSETNY